MGRAAIFVDAGYLYAEGSRALFGAKKPRSTLTLDVPTAIRTFEDIASEASGGCSLLRIYWYDGSTTRGQTTEQELLANSDNVKLRLGVVNDMGQQKGVDSLIVTDLIALARNQAVTDAVLLSGDEDVRIGVEIAQGYGVRVHLVGIEPSEKSQSNALRQESDTKTGIKKETMAKLLSARGGDGHSMEHLGEKVSRANEAFDAMVSRIVDGYLPSLNEVDVNTICSYETGVPREYDGVLLARARRALGRDLEPEERRRLRQHFTSRIRGCQTEPS